MRLETWHAPPGDRIPNHRSFAVLIYHGVDGVADGPDAARRLFAAHGWGGSWVDGARAQNGMSSAAGAPASPGDHAGLVMPGPSSPIA